MSDLDRRKLLSGLCHGAIFLSSTIISIGIPIAVLFITDDPVVKENARESLNFHINLYIYSAICLMLTFIIIGIPLFILLGIASFIMPIIALVKVLSNPTKPYRYPMIFRLVQ